MLPSDEVVGDELQQAAPHLRAGLRAYAKPTGDHFDHWAKTAKVTEKEKNFVKKLSDLLVSESEW